MKHQDRQAAGPGFGGSTAGYYAFAKDDRLFRARIDIFTGAPVSVGERPVVSHRDRSVLPSAVSIAETTFQPTQTTESRVYEPQDVTESMSQNGMVA